MGSHRHTGDCEQVFALLSEWLDLELPAGSCQEIEEHLADCPPCIEFVESLRKTVALCHTYESGETPPPIDPEAKEELKAAYQRMLAARGAL